MTPGERTHARGASHVVAMPPAAETQQTSPPPPQDIVLTQPREATPAQVAEASMQVGLGMPPPVPMQHFCEPSVHELAPQGIRAGGGIIPGAPAAPVVVVAPAAPLIAPAAPVLVIAPAAPVVSEAPAAPVVVAPAVPVIAPAAPVLVVAPAAPVVALAPAAPGLSVAPAAPVITGMSLAPPRSRSVRPHAAATIPEQRSSSQTSKAVHRHVTSKD